MRTPSPSAISPQAAGSGTSEFALAVRNGAEKSKAPFVSGQLVTGTPGTNSEGFRPVAVSVSEMKNPSIVLNVLPVYWQYRISLMMVVPGSRNAT